MVAAPVVAERRHVHRSDTLMVALALGPHFDSRPPLQLRHARMVNVLPVQTETLAIATGAFVAERDDWPTAVARATRERWAAIELTAISERLYLDLEAFLRDAPDALAAFKRVSVHAPVLLESSRSAVAELLARGPAPFDMILHPDVYGREDAIAKLARKAVFENMDANKAFGRDVHDVAEVLERFPDAGFCLDVAHVWTCDRSLRLGLELLDAFGERLRQLHVSGIEPDGTHRPTTGEDLQLYEPLLARCRHGPWVLESELWKS